MKTTLELPDELMREIKILAAREDRKLKDVVPELLRRGLATKNAEEPAHYVPFPSLARSRQTRAKSLRQNESLICYLSKRLSG